jgi:competence protein ComEA
MVSNSSPAEELELVDSERNIVGKSNKKFNFESFIDSNKIPISLALLGLILVGFGAFMFRQGSFGETPEIEVLESASSVEREEIVVEVAGAVEKPGVYRLENGSRVEDLLIAAGGVSASADRDWMEKMINRAARLKDGQKLYIPGVDEQTDVLSANSSGGEQTMSGPRGSGLGDLVNINVATLKELDSLPGIGPVYGQNIIEHRPYSSVEELLSRDVIPKSTYEKIKDKIKVY